MRWGTLAMPRPAKVRESARFAAQSRRFDGGNWSVLPKAISAQPSIHSVAPPLASLGASEQKIMPRYIDSAGRAVSASQALDNVGKIRPGFNLVLETGERAHFDIMMRDAAPRPMFFHDAEDPEKAYAAQQAQLSDQRRNAWKTPAAAVGQ